MLAVKWLILNLDTIQRQLSALALGYHTGICRYTDMDTFTHKTPTHTEEAEDVRLTDKHHTVFLFLFL